jgi:hypothetical protein
MSRMRLAAVVALGVAAAGLGRPADDKPIDDEGFIRSWLVLAPIPLAEGEDPADALGKAQLPDEAKLAPKDGDKVKVGTKELAWKKVQAGDYFFDLKAFVGENTDRNVGYAVCYLESAADRPGLTLKIGSDDQCKVYLNGKEVFKFTEERATDKDQDSVGDLTLKKGTNVLVFKVVNSEGEWSACARFVGKDDKPVTDLKVKLTK